MITDTLPSSNLETQTNNRGASSLSTLEQVENKIRAHIFAKRIRLTDLFSDYDKLRTGYVTASQFRRCLGLAMDRGVVLPLIESDYNVLMEHYMGKGHWHGRVKWVSFVDSIDKVFGAKKLESNPTQYIPAPHEVVKPVRPLSPKSEKALQDVIERGRQYVKHHGSDIKSWFKDFDKHNNGYITLNQFRRGIPQNLLSQEEEDLLLQQYSDPVTGTVNYFKMNNDINRKVRRARLNNTTLIAKQVPDHIENEHVPVGTEELLHAVGSYWPAKPSPQLVEEHIKKQVYKDRVRLIEFFRDYDRHNCGLVSEAQFRAGLKLSELHLDESQISTIVKAYMEKDNRIGYRRFCNSIESIFTKSHLEKDPLAVVTPPAREYLVQGCNELSPAEEARCREIIARFKTLIKERRLLLVPFFKDFDKHLGNIGRVTRSHFSRLLSTMKLDVSDNDLHILFKKFEDRLMAKVNYMEFIRTIDTETYNTLQKSSPQNETDGSDDAVESSQVATEAVIERIRYHVATKRIRVSEFFKDFDKLRCYSIPKQEFVRGINRIGLTLTALEYAALVEKFKDSEKKGCCHWKDFEQLIERVFNDVNLESQPTKVPEITPITASPFDATVPLPEDEQSLINATLDGLAEHLRVRQASIKPFFKDFDKLCTGHVTKTQFRQCLTYLKVFPNDEVFELICKRYKKPSEIDGRPATGSRDPVKDNAERICYLRFLRDLEERTGDRLTTPPAKQAAPPLPKASTANKHATLRANLPPPPALANSSEINKLLMRIKTKAKTERIRVIDFMADFDHLKHGKITKSKFRRALKVVFLDLTEAELQILEGLYACDSDSDMVNYVAFSDAIESVFTVKGLEKMPLREPEPFDGYENGTDPDLNVLTPEEEEILQKTVTRLCEKIRQRRMDVLTYLEDFDFVREGTITINQLRSVLATNNLPVDDTELKVIARKFTTDKNLERINYRSYAWMIMEALNKSEPISVTSLAKKE